MPFNSKLYAIPVNYIEVRPKINQLRTLVITIGKNKKIKFKLPASTIKKIIAKYGYKKKINANRYYTSGTQVYYYTKIKRNNNVLHVESEKTYTK
jgi:hypothetical protein